MENNKYESFNNRNADFLTLDLSDCLDHLADIGLIKSEPTSFEDASAQSHSSNSFRTKYESVLAEAIFSRHNDAMMLDDLCQMDDDCQMTSSEYECDIVNLDLRTSEAHIKDLLEIHSPDSWNSSHPSLLERLSVDSRPSTSHTLSTNPSLNELCTICNDLATGKHYGVSACEGCKGFFKRTIRKKLTFTCREFNNCPVTEKLRNRCQACRFKKCLEKGMKIEAVQKERPSKRKLSISDSSVSSPEYVITADSIYRNELSSSNLVIDTNCDETMEVEETKLLCSIINKQLFSLVMWAKSVPGFSQLDRSDQMILLNKSWVEIFLASVAFRTTLDSDCYSLKMDDTYRLTLSVAANLGLQQLIIRIRRELVTTLRCLSVDQMEMACLKIIILFDSNFTDLKSAQIVRNFRLCIFDILKKYVNDKYPKQPSRIYKLLLKLSSIRGLTACFVHKMRDILHDCLTHESTVAASSATVGAEFLFPLFKEMMSQRDFPFS